ncbi:tyramine oxidase subunit B [Mycobacterium sp. ITM-2016-00317]|uniref:tyramine oxidase subunit B n=1 Tax=Mycobacterium sp. ITM-2016-00317 TaxID=2099694 RepID=UPI00287FA748|nr:tyramine oxidase subunit B [Mycobacterium sp. ITM-2016-00317]WNG88048.1 tyramine oxidase subunit B [Mycobacterium sp. ITM-2016-00317]
MSSRTEFLFLSEPDCIDAGVLDATRCVDVCEEVFGLLAQGDYLMGGPSHNSHGLGVAFPKSSPFPNMPLAGPDRRFVAMPGYLGGRFDICGNKWYGSNHANTAKGLPRSVLTLMLNDKETGEPLCLMSANLLSSARTGAVPAVAARHLASPTAGSVAVLGCGPINKACLKAIASQLPNLKRVYLYDIFEAAAEKLADWARQTLGVDAVVENDLQRALAGAEVVTVAASRVKPLVVQNDWLHPDATVLISGPISADDAFWLENRVVLDHVALHEAYVDEAVASLDKQAAYDGVIGGPLYRLIDDGKLPALKDFTDLGSLLQTAAERDDDGHRRTVFVACGMSVFDLAWGYEIYRTAQDKGLGTHLALWDTPYAE